MNEAQTDSILRRTFRGSRDALWQRAVEEPDLTWRVLVTLNTFRLLIAISLLALFLARSDPRFFGHAYPTLFAATASGYLVFAVFWAAALRQRWIAVETLGTTQILVDIVAVVTLMHASGGISSGLGGLLVVFIGAGSLVLPIPYPAILAAVATFATLGEQALGQFSGFERGVNYPAAGILCAILFAMALAAQPLARRIQASEALARKFGIDLKNISELNEYIVQHLRESIVVLDADDSVRLINSSAMQLLGGGGTQPGVPLRTLSEPLAGYIQEWREDGAQSSHAEFTLISEGNNVRINAHLAPLAKDGQRAGPILIFLEDVSIMNARVQQSKLASLGRLSASIAHEIRNPLGAISHAAQLLAESDKLDPADKRLTEIIDNHSKRVNTIIENVQQLSRRSASHPQELALADWLRDFRKEFLEIDRMRSAQLELEIEAEDARIRVDPGHLHQVLTNLCQNAVEHGGSETPVRVQLRRGDRGVIWLDVLDQGPGIDPETAEQMFEPFYTTASSGTGLGLYIARELCEMNQARLSYQRPPEGGSRFRIRFTA